MTKTVKSKTAHFLAETAQVDAAAVAPLPGSRKVYVEGSRPDIRVPFREITLAPTKTSGVDEQNPPLLVYDTSGPYTDPSANIDLRQGLPELRRAWIEERKRQSRSGKAAPAPGPDVRQRIARPVLCRND